VLPPALTETPVLEKFGLDPATMPMKPMTVDRCVYEGLRALTKNRPIIIPGRINRIMTAVIPAGMRARMFAKRAAATATPQS
jgi:short-subunit dehydrogenase